MAGSVCGVPRRAVPLLGAGIIVASLTLAGYAGASTPKSPRAGHHADAHSGDLTATGICPFYYEFDTSGPSYSKVSTAGTLSGFAPDTRYYMYANSPDNDNGPYNAPVTATVQGQLVFDGRNLDLPGPSQFGDYPFNKTNVLDSRHPAETNVVQFYVSTDPDSLADPPDDVVYEPPTTLTANPQCSPWTADGGTTIPSDETAIMWNRDLHLGTPPWEHANGPLNYELFYGSQNKVLWKTPYARGSEPTIRLVMQRDGNLVLYSGNRAVWATGTEGHPGSLLVLQYDHNLVIYSAQHKALWSTRTEGRT